MAELSCGLKFAKYLVFLFNLLIFLMGAFLLGIGSFVYCTLKPALFDSDGKTKFDWPPELDMLTLAMIGIGALIMIMGFFGCCGACLENTCMLITFDILLSICFVALVAMTALMFLKKDEIFAGLTKMMSQVKTKMDKEQKMDFCQTEQDCQKFFEKNIEKMSLFIPLSLIGTAVITFIGIVLVSAIINALMKPDLDYAYV